MRPRVILFILAGAVIVVLTVLGIADEFLVDLLWFSSLGYRSVFVTSLLARLAVFAVVFAAAVAAFYLSGLIALRATPDSRAAAGGALSRRSAPVKFA